MSVAQSEPGRGTILVICQVYAPDPAAVGQQVTDAAEELARRGWRVVVYTSARGYDDPSRRYAGREQRRGVDVRRLPLSSFGKSSIAVRLLAQALFMIQAVIRGIFTRRLRVVLVSTSPPFAGAGGTLVSWLRRIPMVWWVMDLNPDQMIVAGRLSPSSVVARVFDFLNRLTLRRAAVVVVLDRFMAERVNAKRDSSRTLQVIPPWPHVVSAEVAADRVAAFRARHGLEGRFVVMYSGNHAIQHPLDTLLAAADRLAADDRFRFVFIGGGAGKAAVEERVARGAPNILSLPFEPLENVGASLSAADLHVVSMGDEVVGIVHPCKVYGALAVGRPVLFFGPDRSHVGDLMRQADIGWRVDHGDPAAAVSAIVRAADAEPASLAAMGRRAADAVAAEFSRERLCGRVCGAVETAAAGPARGLATDRTS